MSCATCDRTVSADANNQVTFQERVTDEDGDSLTLLSFELDTIDGVTQSGGARSPGWLNFSVQKNTLNDGSSELLLDVALDQSGLQAETDYEFKAVVDDGTVTVPHTVKFCIGGILGEIGPRSGGEKAIGIFGVNEFKQFDLATPWDVTTRTEINSINTPGWNNADQYGKALWLNDGNYLIVNGAAITSLQASTPYDITSLTIIDKFFQDSNGPLEASHFGTRWWTNDDNNNTRVLEYEMTTPYDVSTATKVQDVDFSAQIQNDMLDLTFKHDGTKLYLTDEDTFNIHQYTLGNAFDLASATYDGFFDHGPVANIPDSIQFKPGGNEMFTTYDGLNDFNRFELDTPWDIVSGNVTKVQDIGINFLDVLTFG
jgi:hypothetical protein